MQQSVNNTTAPVDTETSMLIVEQPKSIEGEKDTDTSVVQVSNLLIVEGDQTGKKPANSVSNDHVVFVETAETNSVVVTDIKSKNIETVEIDSVTLSSAATTTTPTTAVSTTKSDIADDTTIQENSVPTPSTTTTTTTSDEKTSDNLSTASPVMDTAVQSERINRDESLGSKGSDDLNMQWYVCSFPSLAV